MKAEETRARFAALGERNPLPDGTLTVGGGLVVNGIMSYVFLGIAARTLGVDAFGPLSVLWALIYLVGPGFFLPLEQEVSRSLANRWARGVGVGPLVKQAGLLGTALIGALVLTTLVAAPLLLDHFDDPPLSRCWVPPADPVAVTSTAPRARSRLAKGRDSFSSDGNRSGSSQSRLRR